MQIFRPAPPSQPDPSDAGGGNRLAREGAGYLLVGLLLLAIDWGCFVALTALDVPVAPANIAARVTGAVLGFWLNGAYTFAEAGVRRTGRAHFARFLGAWLLVSALSTVGVVLIERAHGLAWAWAGKPLLDAAAAGVGFLMAKFWIYR